MPRYASGEFYNDHNYIPFTHCNITTDVLQGGGEQIRFQTPPGKLLAVATGNNINIVDVGTWVILCSLKVSQLVPIIFLL